ncbi:DinB family protein [Pseudonocardia sp. N23]|uniref:DinB family protein n=1 Tax=Pseudonocardia sp. N23 TaxID=1987376 RepID=UPI000BFC1200|nr:DinB family protein [Pseudonocardia sp. N23]GAY10692.1 hypothetical protein TOK_5053 [Pseudonocardia sp. N23]
MIDTQDRARTATGERADLLEALAKQRFFLVNTLRELSDEQLTSTPTVSELCLVGLVKHVAATEDSWLDFIENGASKQHGEPDYEGHANSFRLLPGETVAGVLAEYERVAARATEIVTTLPDLDHSQLLPEAPWFEPGARWSARRVLLHIVAETAQHCGHADIIREAIDGAKSMG